MLRRGEKLTNSQLLVDWRWSVDCGHRARVEVELKCNWGK
jgi:hypothetical protein